MAVTWGKGNPWPDKENKVTINGGSETEVTITVLAGAACGTYQVTYDNDATEPHCTGVTTFQVTGCGGGGCSDITINIKETVTELTKDGGEIVFEHGTVPEPTPTPTECGSAWTPPATKSGWSDAQWKTLLKSAYDCSYSNNDWKACETNNCSEDFINVQIVNDTDCYIPYAGYFYPIHTEGSTEWKWLMQYRNYSNFTEYKGKMYGHYCYGKSNGEGQDSNFFVAPSTSSPLMKCYIKEFVTEGTNPRQLLGTTLNDFRVAYATIGKGDLDLHRGLHYGIGTRYTVKYKYDGDTAFTDFSVGSTIFQKGMTFVITWNNFETPDPHHAFSSSDYDDDRGYHVYYDSDGFAEITPTTLYKFK